MNRLKHILYVVAGLLAVVCLLLVLLWGIPAVQRRMGRMATGWLTEQLGVEARVEAVGLQVPGRVALQNLQIRDERDTLMLEARRAVLKMELLPLLRHRVRIRSIQLVGGRAVIYKAEKDGPYNFQFLAEKLKGGGSERQTDISIGSLLLRRCEVRHDWLYAAQTPGRLNPAHLHIRDLNATARLSIAGRDSMEVTLKRLSFAEASGLRLENVEGYAAIGSQGIRLQDFRLSLPHSQVSIQDAKAEPRKPGTLAGYDVRRCEMSATLRPSELAPIVPQLGDLEGDYRLETCLQTKDGDIQVEPLLVATAEGQQLLDAEAHIRFSEGRPEVEAHISQLHTDRRTERMLAQWAAKKLKQEPDELSRIFPLSANGDVTYTKEAAKADLALETALGKANVRGNLMGSGLLDADLRLQDFRVGHLAATGPLHDLERVSLATHVGGMLKDENGRPDLRIDGVAEHLTYRGYTYRSIDFDTRLNGRALEANALLGDPNGEVALQLRAATEDGRLQRVECQAALENMNLNALRLTERLEGERISMNVDADLLTERAGRVAGDVRIENLSLHSERDDDCLVDRIVIHSQPEGAEQNIWLESPVLKARLEGAYEWANLLPTFRQIASTYLPSLFAAPRSSEHRLADDMKFSLHVCDTALLRRLTGIPIAFPEEATADGTMNGSLGVMTLNAGAPELAYGGERLRHVDLHMQCTAENMQTSLRLEREMKGQPVEFGLNAYSAGDQIRSRLHWDNHSERAQIGEVDVSTRFFKNAAGQQGVRGQVHESNLVIGDTLWTIHPANFEYCDKTVDFDSLKISKGEKYLCVRGRVSPQESDSLTADLHGINLAYIFDVINFHSVDFDGITTGRIYARHLTDKPTADAYLQVKNFTFNRGSMGDMDIHANWGEREGSILLEARMEDPANDHQTTVQGSITPGKSRPGSGIDLEIHTHRCNLYFLNKFTASIFTDLTGRATGHVRVFGPFKQINLDGDILVDEARTHVNSTNTDYHLAGDSVILRPDTIWMRHITLYDSQGRPGMGSHYATMNAQLTHHCLKQMKYHVEADAHNLLGYDFRDFGDQRFYGTIYATGQMLIEGQPGDIHINLKGSPMPGSTIVYNSTSPETITEAGFITYKSPTANSQQPTANSQQPTANEPTSDLHLNFDINVTPDMTLGVLMDARSGDNINLHGSGHMLATYYNKGKFQMYGTYRVQDGIYKLSLQDVIHKDFNFQPGGTLTFGGDPYRAALALKATYTVHNVSMDDLSATTLGLSNTRVDCIMNIGGRPAAPVVTFDFDLPTANEDEKEMVRSLINTDEERNMQVIYLLGIGRFYNYEAQNMQGSNQSTTAMSSLLSSSLSSQFNQILSNAMGTNNWSLGANLRTGETGWGWDQLDVEGILSGRLLNNRLLINGNFGYRESYYSTNNFIGDFDVRYLLTPSGSIALKAYNQTNDRYFIQSSLTTQGIGIQFKKDFNRWRELFRKNKKK